MSNFFGLGAAAFAIAFAAWSAEAADCTTSRAPNGAVPGTLAGGPAVHCKPPAAAARPLFGSQTPPAQRPRPGAFGPSGLSGPSFYFGGSVGTDFRTR